MITMGPPEGARKRCGLDSYDPALPGQHDITSGRYPTVKGGLPALLGRDNSPPINALSDEEKSRILGDFARKMIDGSQDIDPDIAAAVDLWDLI